jgi:hypothetical protein
MKRLYAWLAGVAGGIAAYRAFRRRPAPAPVAPPDARADELKAKLAEARGAGERAEEAEAVDTPADDADPDARRRSVHEQGRAAIDEMRGG